MKSIFTFSNLGGEEIVQIKYPSVHSILKDHKFDPSISESIPYINILVEEIIQTHNSHKLNSFNTSGNIFPINKMENIPVYFLDSLLIYFPENDRCDFWLDIFTLNYLYSKKYFAVSLLFFSSKYLANNEIQYGQLIKLLNDRTCSFLPFPYKSYIEEVK